MKKADGEPKYCLITHLLFNCDVILLYNGKTARKKMHSGFKTQGAINTKISVVE